MYDVGTRIRVIKGHYAGEKGKIVQYKGIDRHWPYECKLDGIKDLIPISDNEIEEDK